MNFLKRKKDVKPKRKKDIKKLPDKTIEELVSNFTGFIRALNRKETWGAKAFRDLLVEKMDSVISERSSPEKK